MVYYLQQNKHTAKSANRKEWLGEILEFIDSNFLSSFPPLGDPDGSLALQQGALLSGMKGHLPAKLLRDMMPTWVDLLNLGPSAWHESKFQIS